MMTNNLTKRDWEALSAYIDEQLKPRERAHLEARLAVEPALQAGLYELEQTRAMLRNVPAVRAPRNFTLTPEMAGPRPFSLRIYPVFQYATVIATFLFAMVYALQFGDIISFENQLADVASESLVTQMSEPTEILVEESPTGVAKSDMSKAEEAGGLAAAQPEMDSSPAENREGEAPMAPQFFLETTEVEQEKLAPGEESRGTVAEDEPAVEALVETKTPPPTETPTPTLTPTSTPTQTPTPTPSGILGSTPIPVPGWIPWFLGIFAFWAGLLTIFFRWRQS